MQPGRGPLLSSSRRSSAQTQTVRNPMATGAPQVAVAMNPYYAAVGVAPGGDSSAPAAAAVPPLRMTSATPHTPAMLSAPSAVVPPPTPSGPTRTLQILTATWNVGNKAPSADLSPWLPARGGGFDVIVCGCQEATYKTKRSAAAPSSPASGNETARSAVPSATSPAPDGDGGDDVEVDSEDEDVALVEDTDAVFTSSATKSQSAGNTASATSGEAALRAHAPSSGAAAVPLPAHAHAPPPPAHARGADDDATEVRKSAVVTAAMRGVVGFIDARNDAADKRTIAQGTDPVAIAAAQHRQQRDLAHAKNQSYVDASCPFFEVVKAHLGTDYGLVQSVLMWQIGILVFVHRDHALAIREIEEGTEATGILGVGANKGGVAVKMRLYDTTLVFVNAHLAAHLPHVDKRNSDTAEILNNLRLGKWHMDIDAQFHHAFFMGDLNYRVDPAITDNDIEGGKEDKARAKAYKEQLESTGDFAKLLPNDQLNHAQAEGKALVGFTEAPIDFMPTFKVTRSAGITYQTSRTPSWCDRVLFKSQPGVTSCLRCVSYTCHPSIATSDHKPVSAVFELDVLHPVTCITRGPGAPAAPIARITNLSASDLFASDFSQRSDPYVLFYSSPDAMLAVGKHRARTSWKRQTLHPVWDQPGDVPELLLNIVHASDFEHATLIMVLMDKDIDHDDRLGQAMLPLREFALSKRAMPFRVPVVRGGVQYGTISGSLEIVWPPPRRASSGRSDAFHRKPDDVASAGCVCTVM